MLTVETRQAVNPDYAKTLDTAGLRRHFLAQDMFRTGEIRLIYTHYDRFVMGGAVPAGKPLTLDKVEETKTPSFLDRREMGIVNVGETGIVTTEKESYTLKRGDVLYLGMGTGAVTFSGEGRFYITSCPAHRSLPARLVTIADSEEVKLGTTETSNKRTINQFIHPLVMESCQLVLGYTPLEFRDALHALADGKVDASPLVTGTVGLDGVAAAYDALGDPERHAKILIDPGSAATAP